MVSDFYAIIIKSKNKGVEINLLPIFINLRYSLTSGRPAILVSRERIPASKDAEITIFQSTAERTADVPIVATAYVFLLIHSIFSSTSFHQQCRQLSSLLLFDICGLLRW